MNKDTFLGIIRNKLGNIRPDVLDEIITDFEEHFVVAAENGATEEEICKILGDPSEIARQYLEELSGYQTNRQNIKDAETEDARPEEKSRPEESAGEDSEWAEREQYRDNGRSTFDFKSDFNDIGETIKNSLNSLKDAFDKGKLADDIQRSVADIQRTVINNKAFQNSLRKTNEKLRKSFGKDNFNFNFFTNDDFEEPGDFSGEPTVYLSPDEIKSFELSCKRAVIDIVKSETDKFVIDFNMGDDVSYRLVNREGHVYVTDAFSGRRSKMFDQCTIKVPAGYTGPIAIKTMSGDINVSDLRTCNKATVNTVSGNIDIHDCEALIIPNSASGDINIVNCNIAFEGEAPKRLTVHTASGNIKVSEFESSIPISLDTGSGDVELLESSAPASIRSGSGDITVDELDGDVSVSTGSGDVKIRAHCGNVMVGTGSGDIEYVGSVIDRETKLRTGSGDIKFSVKEALAPIVLETTVGTIYTKIKNTDGEIVARTTTGDVRMKLGRESNINITTDSGEFRDKRENKEINRQKPVREITIGARRGRVLIEDLD